MLYKCKIKKLDNVIEEATLIEINGYELYCFISYCPFKIFENSIYEVELNYEILNNYKLNKSNLTTGFIKINNTFAYKITGKLKNNQLILPNMIFEKDDFLSNYSYLDNNLVTLEVDRITVSFVKKLSTDL